MSARWASGWVVSLLIAAPGLAGVASCGAGAPVEKGLPVEARDVTAEALRASCALPKGHRGPLPEAGVRQGSTVALAREGERLYAYVADRERNALTVVDLRDARVLASAKVGGAPEQLMVLPDGRIAVAVGSASHVEVFAPGVSGGAPTQICARAVPAGPFGLALSPDGKTVAVTSAWDAALTTFDADELTALAVRPVARSPRGVLLDDQQRAFVSHLTGATVSVVDLAGPIGAPRAVDLRLRAGSARAQLADLDVARDGTQAYALVGVELTPATQADPAAPAADGPEGRVPLRARVPTPVPKAPQAPRVAPAEPPRVETPPAEAPVTPPAPQLSRIVVPMVSVDPGDPERPTRLYYGPPPTAGVAKQASTAVVVDVRTEKSLSTRVLASTPGARQRECLLPRAAAARSGTSLVYVACLGTDELFELDGRSSDPMRTVLRRFSLPKGPTGVAIAGKEAVAVVYSAFDDTLSLVPLDREGAPTSVAIDDRPVPFDAKLVLGRELFYRTDDARMTSDGVACSSCHPDGGDDALSWSTPEGMRQTLMLAGRLEGSAPYGWNRNQGTLEEYIHDTSTRLGGGRLSSHETAALAAYVKSLPAPPVRATSRDAARGEALFLSAGCATCHVGIRGADGQLHDVTGEGTGFDTPSLLHVGATGPYFHDGRYRTLDALLSDEKSKMGHPASLSADDRRSLRVFLETL